MAHIANAYIRRIMIDTWSSTDILYLDAFHKLGMTNRDLIPMTSTLIRFTNDAIILEGVATLPITFGDEPRTKILMFPTPENFTDPTLDPSPQTNIESTNGKRIENFTPKASEAGLRGNLDMLKEHRAKAHLKNLHY
ncbi:hypothetical protein B296_00011705 [Ensete ventricosum]|uniref:Uncharacterized protein n=1 Tax=Ensete ventricosum TaxID=4639 RepID=A0A426ZL75_ENSVE|nr:hypothetical protein B296_00011705 [Ensete ventricosum]